jgi:hypothetical protein
MMYLFRPDPTLYREASVPACIRLDIAAVRPDAYQYSNSLRFFPRSNKGKIDQPSGRCGIPFGRASPYGKNRSSNITVRTSVSLGPDARSSVKEIADLTSTVRTSSSLGPDTRIADMEIAC